MNMLRDLSLFSTFVALSVLLVGRSALLLPDHPCFSFRLTAYRAGVILEAAISESEGTVMQIRAILFPTDFSNGARAAIDHVVSLARDYQARLILLYVIQDITIAEWYVPSSLSVAGLIEDMQKSAWQEMEKLGAELSPRVKDIEKMVVRGVPFVEIIRTAREKNADLIVIGTHGRTGIDHMLFGSTADKVVRKASCPVLTVRMAGKEVQMP
jgi:nucleotide-binding universal stress UspA family protein